MRRRGWGAVVLMSIGCTACGLPQMEPPPLPAAVNCLTATHAISVEDIPATFDRAVRTLLACIPAGSQKAVLAQSERDFVVGRHMGFGMFVRNSWIRANGSPLLADLCALGFDDAEDMSSALFAAVWHRIHERPMDVRARAACDRAWSAESRRLRLQRAAAARIESPPFDCIDETSVQAARNYWEPFLDSNFNPHPNPAGSPCSRR